MEGEGREEGKVCRWVKPTSFMMLVRLRTSVATRSGEPVRHHMLNSVLYSSSDIPGQCSRGFSLSHPL